MDLTSEQRTETDTVLAEVLAAHPEFYVATCLDGTPWVNGAFFAGTSPYDLVLVLETHGRTLTAIHANPRVAVMVSTGRPYEPFLQGSCTAEVVDGADADEVRRVLLAKVPQAEAFFQYPHRAVRLTVSSWRVTDVARGWIPGRVLENA
jgi:hypothetical protein